MLLQCGSERLSPAAVALLGRFLPRLGPLPQGERPFFLKSRRLFGGGAIRPQLLDRNFGKSIGRYFEFPGQLGKGTGRFVTALVHVQRPVDLELNGVQSGGWVAVMLGDEAAGIGLVTAHRVT